MRLIKKGSNELIACLSIFLFTSTRFIFINDPSKSFLVLLFGVTSLYAYFFTYNFFIGGKVIFGKVFLYFILCFLILVIDSAFRNNSMSSNYLYDFFIYVFIPFLFFINIRSIRIFLVWYCAISILNYLFYGLDPLNNYLYTSDYMYYGFNVALPGFIGSFLGAFYFKKRILFVFVILTTISILFFSNRSCTISMFLFILIYLTIFFKKSKKYIFSLFILFYLIFLYYKSSVIDMVYTIKLYLWNNYNYNSYALTKLVEYLKFSDKESLFANRLVLWDQSLSLINNYLFFGLGMGSYQSIFGNYSHNIFIDSMFFFGVFITILLLLLTIKNILKIAKKNNQIKLFCLLIFILWFPKLLFSSYFTQNLFFFLFLMIPYFNFFHNKNIDVK
jgi:hypothetical protein